MSKKVSIGLVGLGYWGNNYLRVLMQLKDVELKYVCDSEDEKLARCPEILGVTKTTDYTKLAEDKDLNAVIVATPASTHYKIVKEMLKSGKNVLVEKPITTNYNEALELCYTSKQTGKILMVGHVYCFNPAVKYIKNILENEELGELHYGIGLRLGLGPIRSDASCTWDLATHDIAILDYLLGENSISVSATAKSFIQNGIFDYANIRLHYRDRFSFNLIVSWYFAEKIRIWYLMGSKAMLKFDDMNKDMPITFYKKSIKVGEKDIKNILPKEGEVIMPYINHEEPLLLQLKHFIDSINNNERPLTDCEQGMRVVRILEAIEESIRKEGVPIYISGND